MSIRVDKVQLEIEVREHKRDAEIVKLNKELGEAGRKYRSLQNEVDKLADKQKNGAKLTEAEANKLAGLKTQLANAKAEYEKLDKQKTEYVRENKLETMTLHELSQEYRSYQQLLRNLDPNSDYYKKTQDYLGALKDRMSELNRRTVDTKSSLQKFAEGFNHIAFAITNTLAIADRIKSWIQPFADEAREYSDVVADVAKYTGQSINEVRRMNDELEKIDTRSSVESLNELAGAAGRLGISAEKDIIGFVDAADKINTALGDDLGEGAIDAIGKMTMVFGEDKTKGLNGAMLATGSALNVLGAASSANTGYIADFTSKLAAVAVQARISQTDIMGYASALSQAGETGETAASVLTQFLVKMFSDPAKFAKAAKLDVKEFSKLIRTDANQAVLTFLDSMKKAGGFEQLAPMLKSLKMQGTQAVPVLTELANGLDNVIEAQRTAKQAYDEGTSIIDEFNQVNQTAQAQHEKNEKALQRERREIGERLLPAMNALEAAQLTGLGTLKSLISFTLKHRATIATLAVVVGTYSAVLAVAWAREKQAAAAKAINLAMDKAIATATALKTVAVEAYNVVVNRMQGHTIAAARAQLRLNAAMSANVFGAIATAIATVVTVGYQLYKRLTDIGEAQRTLNAAAKEARTRLIEEQTEMDNLIGIVKSANSSEEDRRKALEEINGKLMDKHLGNLTEEQIRTGKAKLVLDQYNQSLMDQIENEVLLGKLKEARTKQMNAENGEFDTSFLDDAKAVMKAIGGYWKNALIPGRSALKGIKEGWNSAMEDTRQQVLKETQNTIDAINNKIEENRERLSFDKAMSSYLDNQRNTLEGSGTATNGTIDGNTNATTHTKSDSELKKEQSAREKQCRELEAQAKAAWEREKIELRQQYQGRKQLQDEWHEKEFDAEQRYIDRLAKIRVEYNASEADRMEVANMQLDAIAREANRREEANKRHQQESLRNIDQMQAAEEVALLRQKLTGEIETQEEFDRRKLEEEIKYQKLRIEHLKQGSAEYLAAQRQLLSLELQQQQSDKKNQEGFTGSYQQTNNTILHDHFSQTDSFEAMRKLNDEYRQQELISEQQYQQNLTEIDQAETEKRQQIRQAAVDGVNNLLSSASQLFSAMQQRETAQVDAKYKKLIAAAKKQGKDTTKLEEQQEQEKAAIQKKYADRNFKIQVLQIIASTATGIAKTISELGMPLAIPFVAMAAAAGAMQLASAKAAADQAAGLYEGGYSDDYQQGYTKKGNPREQAGVIPVHKNEFVANHRAVANPEVRPVLDVIDRHQKQGDISMLNATRMLEEAYGSGRYRGGYTRGGEDWDATREQQAAPLQDSESMELLRRIERNTAQSLTVRGLREEIAHEESLERRARR